MYNGQEYDRCTIVHSQELGAPDAYAECATETVQALGENVVTEWGTCDFTCPGGNPGEDK